MKKVTVYVKKGLKLNQTNTKTQHKKETLDKVEHIK